MRIATGRTVSVCLTLVLMTSIFCQINVYPQSEMLFDGNEQHYSESNTTSDDAWLNLSLISWQGNTSTTWDTDGTDLDVQFQICIDLDGESDGISPQCTWTDVWNNTLNLSNAWQTTFDLIEDNTTLNITIECWDNDDDSDEWNNGPDACDMNPDDDEWRLYYEVNWSTITTETFSGDGSLGNDTQWGNAESTWIVVVSYYGDEDDDGVSDFLDLCSNSQNSEQVDGIGCSWHQYDWDADGIKNSNDNCPTLQEELCSFTNDYIEIGTINFPVSTYPFMNDRNPLDSLVVSPNGKILSIFSQASQFSCIKKSAIYLLSLDDMSDTIQLDGPNCPSSSKLIGVVGESRHSAGMTFSQNSEFFATSIPQGISIFDAESPGDESLIDEDGNEISTGADYYWDNGGNQYQTIYPQARSILWISDANPYDLYSDQIRPVAVSQNNNHINNGGETYDLTTGEIVDNSTSLVPYSQNGGHFGKFREVNNILLRPDGLSAKATGDRIEIYNIQDPDSIIQSIDFSNNIVHIQTVDDGNSLIVLSGTGTESFMHHIDLLNGNTQEIFTGLDGEGLVKGIHVSKNGLRVLLVIGYDDSERHWIKILERDVDLDGTVDSEDLCPLVSGEFSGCLEEFFDTDEDGVNDKEDQCPGTTKGTNIDDSGCATNQLDNDGDGISDANDQCPNTPGGDSVGLTGCSGSQVDSDGDGVYDAEDNCPSTPGGTTVDTVGCAPNDVVDLDSDGDGVRDSADVCPNSITGIIVDSEGCKVEVNTNDSATNEASGESLFQGCIGIFCLGGIAVALVSWTSERQNTGSTIQLSSYKPTSQSAVRIESQRSLEQQKRVLKEVERQKRKSENQVTDLKRQLAHSNEMSSTRLQALQSELKNLENQVKASENARNEMKEELASLKSQDRSITNETIATIQDSAIAGDSLVGSTKIENQTNISNDVEAIAKAVIDAYLKGKGE